MHRSFVVLLLAALAGSPSSAGAQPASAGRIQFATGDVRIVAPDAAERPAQKGDAINEGDTVVTAGGAVTQLAMSDGGVIAVRPGSRLQIQNFRYEGREDGAERSVLWLVRGSFRAITGVIGRRNRDTYRVQTSTATIGIRGTDHEIVFIPVPAPGEVPIGEPGTYNKVNVGETFVQNAQGTVTVGANQVAFAGVQPGALPVRLERVPDFLRASAPPRGRADQRPVRESAQVDNRREVASRPGGAVQPGQGPLPLGQRVLEGDRIVRPVEVVNTTLDVGNPASGGTSLVAAAFGTAIVGGEYSPSVGSFGSGGMLIDGTDGLVLLQDPAKNPVFVASADGFRFSRDAAPLVDSGNTDLNGTAVRWGIYAGGTVVDSSNGPHLARYFHFMTAPNASSVAELQVPGSATFSTVAGFTKPIDEQGRVGGHVGLNVTLVFGALPRVTGYNLQVQDAGGRIWTGTLQSTQLLSNFVREPNSPNLNVTCSGACQPSGLGSASGFVVGGAARNGMITSYTLKTPNAAVIGSAAVK